MLAKRTDEIGRELVPFVYVSADFTYISVFFFFYLRLRLRLDVLKVISVGNGRLLSENLSLCKFSYKQRVSSVIVRVNHLGRYEGIGSLRYIQQAVGAAGSVFFKSCKLIRIFSAGEAESFKYVKGNVF